MQIQYSFCQANENDLKIYLDSWDDKILELTFVSMKRYIYRGGSIIEGIYEETHPTSFLLEALSSFYQKIPENHSFKTFIIMDIDDTHFFEIIAEKVVIVKKATLEISNQIK